jgi:hypothetical protein
MSKILFSFLMVFAATSMAIAQCSFNNSQFGGGAAPTTAGTTITTSTCNYYGEYSPVTGFLASTVYSLNINTGGYITVFDATFTAVAYGPAPLSFTPPSNGTYNIQWNGAGCTTDFSCHTTTVTNIGPAGPCSNPVNAGTAVSSVPVACSGQTFTLSLNGATTGTGMTYQWQSSTDNVSFSDIPGATSATLQTSQTAMTYYQCIVTCSAGIPDISTSVMVDMGTCVIMGNGTATTCGGTFFDSGGSTGNYLDMENYTMTIYPSTPGSLLQVTFNSFNLETCCDDITVYNGNSTFAPFMGTFATNPGSITSSAADGSLTFVFNSDGSVVYSGWDATISCITPPANDDVCNAIALPVDGTVGNYNNGGAGVEPGETMIAPPGTGYNTLDGWGNSTMSFTTWFTFVAPAEGNVMISCVDVPFDGQVAVYEATDCSDFSTFNLVGANDDAMDFSSDAPMFTVCGLTPGTTYYLVFDSGSTFASGAYSIAISPLSISAGTENGVVDVCSGGVVDLFDGITGYDAGGTWYETIPTFGLSGNTFNTAGVGFITFDFEYVVENGCLSDTSITQVHVFGPSSAGNDGTITACKGENVNLLTGLSGNVDMGGTWYSPTNQPLPGFMTTVSSIPGQFNYDYIASNGVCPDDTANIVVNVLDCIAGVNEFTIEGVQIYPNPSNGLFYISNTSGNSFNYTVTDLNGRIIIEKKNCVESSDVSLLDLSDKMNGLYIITISDGSTHRTFRVIKE